MPAPDLRSPDGSPLWNLLVVTDEVAFEESLREALAPHRFHLVAEVDARQAASRLREEVFHLVLVSTGRLRAGERQLLQAASEAGEAVSIFLFLDRWDQLDPVREWVRPSTWSVLLRPQPMEHLRVLVEHALDRLRLQQEVHYLRHRESYIYRFDRIVGQSPQIRAALRLVEKVAPSDATVLIQGESGTGKELIAAAVHFNSPRRDAPFVAVNCAALHENLLESELFGHEKGSFTGADRQRVGRFEQANGGTVFLDEVGDMSASVQAKLLRVLQERAFERLGGSKTIRVNVRILAATNHDLHKAMVEKRFRQDLYYRLSVVPIQLPPLRDRPEDLLPLAEFFFRKYRGRDGGRLRGFHQDAIACLRSYAWPGNIRELENVVERAVLVAQGEEIVPEDLMLTPAQAQASLSSSIQLPPGGVGLEEVERDLILQALQRTNGVQKKAAKLLGISPRAIHYKIRKHHIGIAAAWGRSARPASGLSPGGASQVD